MDLTLDTPPSPLQVPESADSEFLRYDENEEIQENREHTLFLYKNHFYENKEAQNDPKFKTRSKG